MCCVIICNYFNEDQNYIFNFTKHPFEKTSSEKLAKVNFHSDLRITKKQRRAISSACLDHNVVLKRGKFPIEH